MDKVIPVIIIICCKSYHTFCCSVSFKLTCSCNYKVG